MSHVKTTIDARKWQREYQSLARVASNEAMYAYKSGNKKDEIAHQLIHDAYEAIASAIGAALMDSPEEKEFVLVLAAVRASIRREHDFLYDAAQFYGCYQQVSEVLLTLDGNRKVWTTAWAEAMRDLEKK